MLRRADKLEAQAKKLMAEAAAARVRHAVMAEQRAVSPRDRIAAGGLPNPHESDY